MVNFNSPATFSVSIGLAYSLVFFTHLSFAYSTWQDTVFANKAMKYKGLVDPNNKPFGNLLPFEVQVIIMFWTQCFMTNDRRTKMNEELTRLPCCLCTSIPMSVAFSFSSGYKRFSSGMENKPYPRFYGCPHCFRRKTKQYSVRLNISVLFRNSFALCFRGLVAILFTSMTISQSFTFKQYFVNTLFLLD